MSRYRRSTTQGATFFFTLNTFRRQPVLLHDEVRAALREGLKEVRSRLPFKIHAWVLLPDHLHCIWELPPGDTAFGLRWGQIKRHVTLACDGELEVLPLLTASGKKRHEGTLWQRRFWEHQIRNEADFVRHVDYIHWNPVKHGHVRQVAKWPYSTFHRYVRSGVYAEDWGGIPDMSGDFGE
jgi:putative transposase